MDTQTARHLSALTADFYAHVSASFSATRQTPWQGWERLLDGLGLQPGAPLTVLDLACGNLRFERFLQKRGIPVRAWACDSCDELAREGIASLQARPQASESVVSYQHIDIAEELLSPGSLSKALDVPPCQLSVAFGFMHHLPFPQQRAELLRTMVEHTARGGWVVISFWQFAQSERLMAKARPVTGGDEGDYLLGWQDEVGVQRYCHSFTEVEIDALASACASHASEFARFSADGKEGNLNRYLVLSRTL